MLLCQEGLVQRMPAPAGGASRVAGRAPRLLSTPTRPVTPPRTDPRSDGAGRRPPSAPGCQLPERHVKLLPWTAKMADLNPIEHARGATQSVIWNKELINPSPDLETFIHDGQSCLPAWKDHKEVTGTPQKCGRFTRTNCHAKVERLIRLKGDQS